MALKVSLRVQGVIGGEQINRTLDLFVPDDDVNKAKLRIAQMLDTRYDGLIQKPEVFIRNNDQLVVSFDGTPVTDPDALLAEALAAAHDTSVVTHG
ncbi:MAG: hypothetical protein WAS27_01425 [Candidatus Saccharimonadales bacterium]